MIRFADYTDAAIMASVRGCPDRQNYLHSQMHFTSPRPVISLLESCERCGVTPSVSSRSTTRVETCDLERFVGMRKEDFTPDAIHDELWRYSFQESEDGLGKLGGGMIVPTRIADIEITTVSEKDFHFIVDGTATLKVTADWEIPGKWSGDYPMKFSYEFDSDGKIVSEVSCSIDSSAFDAGVDDYEAYLVERSRHKESFQRDVLDVVSLLEQSISPLHKKCLHRLLYANVITALECYLSGFFISRIKDDKELLRRFIETTPTFREQKMSVSDVFQTMDAIEKRANSYLFGLVWHRLSDVSRIYKNVLGVSFPDLTALRNAIQVRNELVHRNGRKLDGTEDELSETDIRRVIKTAEELTDHIEMEWLRRVRR